MRAFPTRAPCSRRRQARVIVASATFFTRRTAARPSRLPAESYASVASNARQRARLWKPERGGGGGGRSGGAERQRRCKGHWVAIASIVFGDGKPSEVAGDGDRARVADE